MQEDTQDTESIAVEVETPAQAKDADKAEKPKRKSPEREEVRLAVNPSVLLSKEGFALYIGKTVAAVVAMAKE
ncbi:hypothetical protein AB4828_004780, partial [Salmonella enterica subsp. enterica]